jgi:hypothetical protein
VKSAKAILLPVNVDKIVDVARKFLHLLAISDDVTHIVLRGYSASPGERAAPPPKESSSQLR